MFNCPICDYNTTFNHNLTRHMRAKHNMENTTKPNIKPVNNIDYRQKLIKDISTLIITKLDNYENPLVEKYQNMNELIEDINEELYNNFYNYNKEKHNGILDRNEYFNSVKNQQNAMMEQNAIRLQEENERENVLNVLGPKIENEKTQWSELLIDLKENKLPEIEKHKTIVKRTEFDYKSVCKSIDFIKETSLSQYENPEFFDEEDLEGIYNMHPKYQHYNNIKNKYYKALDDLNEITIENETYINNIRDKYEKWLTEEFRPSVPLIEKYGYYQTKPNPKPYSKGGEFEDIAKIEPFYTKEHIEIWKPTIQPYIPMFYKSYEHISDLIRNENYEP